MGDFMSAFWNACVTSADLNEGYVRGCVGACLQLLRLSDASELSASQMP